ncbi:MAG: hypothetical protein KJ051_11285, partial [Thermoleophilia bacterium]|nr:hypothetical protein [Thermoleophilia bacterium]
MAIVVFAAVLAGCGTSGGEQRDGATSSDRTSAAATARIDKCVERLLGRSTTDGASEQQVRRYVKDTYCAPFEQNGWVYDDGALSIAAQSWLDSGGECETEGAVTGAADSDRGPTRTIPCTQTNIIDCALLHHVRRTEVEFPRFGGHLLTEFARSG